MWSLFLHFTSSFKQMLTYLPTSNILSPTFNPLSSISTLYCQLTFHLSSSSYWVNPWLPHSSRPIRAFFSNLNSNKVIHYLNQFLKILQFCYFFSSYGHINRFPNPLQFGLYPEPRTLILHSPDYIVSLFIPVL